MENAFDLLGMVFEVQKLTLLKQKHFLYFSLLRSFMELYICNKMMNKKRKSSNNLMIKN